MLLLHSHESELSRTLLDTLPTCASVVHGDGGYPVSAYPTVVVFMPAKEVYLPSFSEEGGLLGMVLTATQECPVLLPMPESWEAVEDYINLS